MSHGRMLWPATFLATLDTFNILGYHKIQFMTICFIHKHMKTGRGTFFSSIFFVFNIMENNKSSGFEAANNFDFFAP